MTAVAITTRIVDRGMYTKTRLFTPGPHTGVLMPLAGEPLADADLSIVPEDADLAIAARISPEALYGELLDCLHELSDGASVNYGRDFLRELTRIETDLGLSIKDDLLASLGDTVVVSSAPSQGGFLTGTLLSISVRDSAKLSAAIDKMESFLKTKLPGGSARADRCACSTRPQQPQDEPSSCPECGRNRMPVDRRDSIGIESIEVARTDVHYITGSAGFPWPIAPAWAVHKDRLYLAGWPQVIASAIEREALGPLTAETGFLGTRTKVSRNASVLCYANTPKVLRQAYNWLLLGWTAGANYMAGQTSVGVRPDWLPALSTLEKYTRPDITVVLADQEGITIESYGSLPGTGVTFAPLPSPLTVGVLLPSLNYARRKAKRAISKDNLHTIGMAISLYVSENADQWPPDLASLVADDGHPIEGQSFRMLACETLVSPLSGRQVPQLVGGKLSGEIDYMYTPLDARAPGNLVAAYERPENYSGKGTLVLFADSHVAWLDMPEFQKAMVRTRKSLETKAAKLESEAF